MKHDVKVVFFDLFYTLVAAKYNNFRNEYDVLRVTSTEWEKSPLSELFDSTIFSYEVGYLKPQSQIYEIALRKMNVNPKNSIFIGEVKILM